MVLKEIKSKSAWIRVARDFGGALSRSKIRIDSLTAIPASTGTASPAFSKSWSAIGKIQFEYHIKTSSRFQVGEVALVSSNVGSLSTTAHMTLLDITFEFNATNRVLTVWTRGGGTQSKPSPFDGNYFCTGRTSSLNVSEKREIGGGFMDNLLSLTTAKETTTSKTLVKARIGPFPYRVETDVFRMYRAAYVDGRVTLRMALNSSWLSDCSGSASQYAQVFSGSCASSLKWKADFNVKNKGGDVSRSVYTNCTGSKSTLPVLCSWAAPSARFDANFRLALEVRPNQTGKAGISVVYQSTLGAAECWYSPISMCSTRR